MTIIETTGTTVREHDEPMSLGQINTLTAAKNQRLTEHFLAEIRTCAACWLPSADDCAALLVSFAGHTWTEARELVAAAIAAREVVS